MSNIAQQYPNPLALDIEEDWHQHLLEKGNLGKKPRPAWSDEHSWTSLGYYARVTSCLCACGKTHKSLVGLFHEERTPSGATRSLALSPNAQIPLRQSYPVRVDHTSSKLCPSCLTSHGFGQNI